MGDVVSFRPRVSHHGAAALTEGAAAEILFFSGVSRVRYIEPAGLDESRDKAPRAKRRGKTTRRRKRA